MARDRRTHHADLRAGEHPARRAHARSSRPSAPSPRSSAARRRRSAASRQLGELLRPAGRARREREAQTGGRVSSQIGFSRSVRWRSRRGPCRSCSSCKSSVELTTTAAARDRRRRQPRVPHDDDRQGNRGGLALRYGRDCARRRRRSRHHAGPRGQPRFSC